MKIIGICGGSGSGKTTLVEAVRAHLSTDIVSVISQDSYYKNHDTLTFEERCELNYDHPNAIDYDLFVSHLKQLKDGESIHSPIYSYSKHLRSDQFTKVFPKPVVVGNVCKVDTCNGFPTPLLYFNLCPVIRP